MNTETIETPRVHHPYSPSKLQVLEACPCYESEFTGSEAAETGTRQHTVADTGEDDAVLPDEKALAAVECMKFVDEKAAEWPGCTRIQEEYLPIDDRYIRSAGAGIDFQGTTAGYLDVGLVSADGLKARVIDFKFGMVAVEPAPNNLQGIAYLLGLLKRFPTLEEVEVMFLAPHRDEISHHTFTRAEFPGLVLRVKTVVQRAVEARQRNDFSMANPTVSGCLFCSRLGQCPKVAEFALRLGKKYAPLEMPESISTAVFLDPLDAQRGIKFAQVIKRWCDAYRAQVTAKTIDDPNFKPAGYDLIPMQKRTVKSAKPLGDFAKTFLPPEFHAEVEKLYDIGIGALEKLITLATPRGQKEARVEEFGAAALAAGHLELGQPYAFLKQSKKAE